MTTTVISEAEFGKPIIRKKAIGAFNPGTMTTVVDFDEYDGFTLDEPVEHGGQRLCRGESHA